MRISDVQRGKPTVLQVVPGAKDDFGPLPAMTEVEIFSSGLESEALLRVGKSTWKIEGANVHHQDLLSGVLVRALPRVAWVAAREPRDEKLAATSLVVEIREFPSENVWPQPVDLGVDEKVVEAVVVEQQRPERGLLRRCDAECRCCWISIIYTVPLEWG